MNKSLLIGPPGSGKTHSVLEKIVTAVHEGRSEEVLLVVPTVSMANHTLHTLARRSGAISGKIVKTIAEFTAWLTPETQIPSPTLSAWLLEQIIQEVDVTTSLIQNEVTRRAAATERMIEECWAAGCDASRIKPFADFQTQKTFVEVFHRYEKRLGELDYISPWQRFRSAATSIRDGKLSPLREIYFDGFFHLTVGEQELIQATMDAVKKTTITLVNEPRQHFTDKGGKKLSIHRLTKILRPSCAPKISRAVTPTHEIEEIARVIIDTIDPAEPSFADYGVVLRSQENYEPIIRQVFERFGIPFQFRRDKLLAAHGNVRSILALLRAAEKGFPAEETIAALCNPTCAAGDSTELDAFDFEIRRNLPGHGLNFLEQHAEPYPTVSKQLIKLYQTAEWFRQTPSLTEWVERICSFQQDWSQKPKVVDESSKLPCYDQILNWRSTAQVISAFRTSAEEASSILSISGKTRASFGTYLQRLEFVLQRTSLTTPDSRHNVVHILPVHEARQWELPVVFVPGLVENQFPPSARHNLFFNEASRIDLQQNGIPLRSATDHDAEETLLFQIARTRARKALFLSYPQFDEQNKPLLRSFFIKENDRKNEHVLHPIRLREPVPDYTEPHSSSLSSPELRQWITAKHKSFSPTSLEGFLQCPYQYFAEHTLGLEKRPPLPEERFDGRMEGSIVHRTLAQWSQNRSVPVRDILREVFESECHHNCVATTVRTLASLYRIEEDLIQFCAEETAGHISEATDHGYERDFQYVPKGRTGNTIYIRGRIDRYEVISGKYVFVVDYKYSTKDRIDNLVRNDYDKGGCVQGPLYLLGLEQELGLHPAGMQFWGLRKEVTRRGWTIKEPPLPRSLRDRGKEKNGHLTRAFLNQGLQRTLDAIDRIRAGDISVEPLNSEKCKYCGFRNLCRIQGQS